MSTLEVILSMGICLLALICYVTCVIAGQAEDRAERLELELMKERLKNADLRTTISSIRRGDGR